MLYCFPRPSKQLSKLWSYVAEVVTIIIREFVEPILEEYRPSGISSLKFSNLSLGTVVPKIEGVETTYKLRLCCPCINFLIRLEEDMEFNRRVRLLIGVQQIYYG